MGMIRGLIVFLMKMAGVAVPRKVGGRKGRGEAGNYQEVVARVEEDIIDDFVLLTSSVPEGTLHNLGRDCGSRTEILRHVLILTYYACLARTAIGIIFILTKTRSYQTVAIGGRTQENLFGDVRVFFMSVVRHSPVFEHAAELAFQAFGEARIEKLLYSGNVVSTQESE